MKIKARSKAAKINAKRGRRRVEGVEREPNGRISRAKEPPSKLALEARARMLQISIEEAKGQDAETYLGSLHIAFLRWKKEGEEASKKGMAFTKCQPEHSLSTAQYYALCSCQAAHNDYLKAIGAPGAYYDGHNGNSGDEDAHKTWVITAKKRWQGIEDAIKEAQQWDRSSNLWAALDHGVKREACVPHMLGSIKALANVLNRHFGRKKPQ